MQREDDYKKRERERIARLEGNLSVSLSKTVGHFWLMNNLSPLSYFFVRRLTIILGAKILDNVYLGGRMAAQNYEWLTETIPNMRYILNVTTETSCYYEKESTFVYKRIAVCPISKLIFLRQRLRMLPMKRFKISSTRLLSLFITRWKKARPC